MAVWETLASRFVWESGWYKLRQDRVRTQDGHEFTYTMVDHPGAVWVVPITAQGQIVLTWQFRYTVAGWCLEVPAIASPDRSGKAAAFPIDCPCWRGVTGVLRGNASASITTTGIRV
jgi:hypothetical protein